MVGLKISWCAVTVRHILAVLQWFAVLQSDQQRITPVTTNPIRLKLTKAYFNIKVCLTQRGMIPLGYVSNIVYLDGVGHKL